jgi:uncharacterized protein (TIGR02147 family)
MNKTVFDYRDYKVYLLAVAEEQERGFRKRLAAAARCQTPYISHVLNGGAHFSWEQAEAISRYLQHSSLETEYFLLLVEFTRAGTPSLRAFLERKLDEFRDSHFDLKARVGIGETVDEQIRLRYYSSWHYSAIHILLSVPGMDTADVIARHLRLPHSLVADCLEFLCSARLAERKGSKFGIGSMWMFVDRTSPLIVRHHTNWRLQAIRSLETMRDSDLRYSSIYSMSAEDYQHIRKQLVSEIERVVETVKKSDPEEVCVMNLDFFRL